MGREVVLVVEDDALVRMSAVDIFEDAGFRALEAPNADDAIGILEARLDIRLVFTDIEMPGSMDGLKLVDYIRERWPRILLIVASGKAMLEQGALPSGARFLGKPYNQQKIADTLAMMLGDRG